MRDLIKEIFAYNGHNRKAWVIAQAVALPRGSRVLDVGAGPAPYRKFFRHCMYQTHDFGKEPGTQGKYAPIDFQSDITAIPLPDQSVDAVLCTEVLEHIPEPSHAIRELGRVLRPGGKLLLSAPLASWLHQEPYHFYGGYTPHWYRKFLAEAAFKIINIEQNMGFFSLFGQEAQRFSALIDPRRTWGKGPLIWMCLTLLWIATLPLFRFLLPILGWMLDRLKLERMCTIGYHVVAERVSVKRPTQTHHQVGT